MMRAHRVTLAAIPALALALLAGCAGTPPDQFYRLGEAGSPAGGTLRATPVVWFAPVSVPDIVDRPQIVTQGEGSRVLVNEQQRWAEPLKLAIGRLLAERVVAQLGLAQVWAYPAEPGTEAQIRVNVAVQRFDSAPGVAAGSTLLWTVRRQRDGQVRSGRSESNAVPADGSTAALVTAHAQVLARAGDAIAAAVGELSASAP